MSDLLESSTGIFTWRKEPDAYIEGEYIVTGLDFEEYNPGEQLEDIINAITKIKTEDNIIQFVREWGIFGYALNHNSILQAKQDFEAVKRYLLFKNNLHQYDEKKSLTRMEEEGVYDIEKEVVNYLNQTDSVITFKYNHPKEQGSQQPRVSIDVKGEHIIHAKQVINEIKSIFDLIYWLKKYYDDPLLAEKTYQKWLNEGNSFSLMLFPSNAEKLKQEYEEKCMKGLNPATSFNEYQLINYLKEIRYAFNLSTTGGAHVQVDEAGQPYTLFESLYQFLKYSLLSEPLVFPVHCHDPKCNQVFIPNRKGQKYCPPMAWEKRSRCEQRHGQELRRKAKKTGKNNLPD